MGCVRYPERPPAIEVLWAQGGLQVDYSYSRPRQNETIDIQISNAALSNEKPPDIEVELVAKRSLQKKYLHLWFW